MRLMTAGWVMKPTTRISPPQRGHTWGSTSYTPADHLRPSAPEGGAVRPVRHRALGRLAWAGGLGRGGGLLAFAPGRIRIEAVVASQVAPSVLDLRQNAGHKLHRVH